MNNLRRKKLLTLEKKLKNLFDELYWLSDEIYKEWENLPTDIQNSRYGDTIFQQTVDIDGVCYCIDDAIKQLKEQNEKRI